METTRLNGARSGYVTTSVTYVPADPAASDMDFGALTAAGSLWENHADGSNPTALSLDHGDVDKLSLFRVDSMAMLGELVFARE